MKTNFSEDEIIHFIEKMANQLQGENILFSTQSNNFLRDIKDHYDALAYVQECGRNEGRMYARIELIESLIDFFEFRIPIN
jgi:predicted hydrocarbon binding protein